MASEFEGMSYSDYATRLMVDTGMTYQEISDQSGVNINTVQNYIKGKTKNIAYDKGKNILRALGGDISLLDRFSNTKDDPIIADAIKEQPTDPIALALYMSNDKLIMSYQAALMRERRINRTLCISLVAIAVVTFVLVCAVIALFVYDFTHPDRGWYQQAFNYLSALI